jgi:hypothetical protein
MKDIASIESFKLNEDGDIVVTAVIENVICTYAGSIYGPPEYAPGLCSITIPSLDLPPLDLTNLNEEELEEVVNRYANLNIYEWKRIMVELSELED